MITFIYILILWIVFGVKIKYKSRYLYSITGIIYKLKFLEITKFLYLPIILDPENN